MYLSSRVQNKTDLKLTIKMEEQCTNCIFLKSQNRQFIVEASNINLIHSQLMPSFYTHWKQQKASGFLLFSLGIKWKHSPEMG